VSATRPATSDDGPRNASLPLIVHVIPYDDIGGVETAADSVPPGPYPSFELRRAYVASLREAKSRPYVYETGVGSENSPLAFIRSVRHLLRLRPKVVILSLWRSCIVGLILKALRPRTMLVVFLHNVKHSNWIDALLTRTAARASSAILADSTCTAEQRLGEDWAPRVRPVSFLTSRLSPVTGTQPTPRFITWCRLHPRKRIQLALEMFALVHQRRRGANLTIIGPDRGERAILEAKAVELGVSDAVEFAGPMDMTAISQRAAQVVQQAPQMQAIRALQPQQQGQQQGPLEYAQQLAQLEAQALQARTSADIQSKEAKAQSDIQISQAKARSDMEISQAKTNADLEAKVRKLEADLALEREKVLMKTQIEAESDG